MILAKLMGPKRISQCKPNLQFSYNEWTEYYSLDLSHLYFFLVEFLDILSSFSFRLLLICGRFLYFEKLILCDLICKYFFQFFICLWFYLWYFLAIQKSFTQSHLSIFYFRSYQGFQKSLKESHKEIGKHCSHFLLKHFFLFVILIYI